MTTKLVKYNPSFLSDDELIGSFVARQADFDWVMNGIRGGSTDPDRHMLLVGLRGAGKTMLALRVAAELRHSPELNEIWYPLVLSEEINHVGTPGEFWLEVLAHLSHEVKNERLSQVREQLIDELDEERLGQSALTELLSFVKSEGKRLLLVVENFNRLVEKQIRPEGARTIRGTLATERGITLLATATSEFDEIKDPGKSLHGFFQIRKLGPLTNEECERVWTSVTGSEPDEGRVKAIRILTGGNPRLLAIISRFGDEKSLKGLMEDLMQLVDDHTGYFKNILDSLSLTEGKVYHALAEIWEPATAREVARITRYNTSTTSSYLAQLVDRGLVEVVSERARKKWYQVTERMYNIYYLMRRRGTSSSRVKALVNFMVIAYGERQTVQLITGEACKLDPESRKDHFSAYEELLKTPCDFLRSKLLEETPGEFLDLPDLPDIIEEMTLPKLVVAGPESDFQDLVKYGNALMYQLGDFAKAVVIFKEAIKKAPDHPLARVNLGMAYCELSKYGKAEDSYRKSIELAPDYAKPWGMLGELLRRFPERHAEAEEAFRKVTELLPDVSLGWLQLGELFHYQLKRFWEAKGAYKKAIALEPGNPGLWLQLGLLCHEHLQRFDEAEDAYRKVIELEEEFLPAWELLGQLHDQCLGQPTEAEQAYRRAIELNSEIIAPYRRLMIILLTRFDECREEALEPMRIFLERTEFAAKSVADIIDTFVWLAACGCGRESLNVLFNSPSADILEPLIVGLKLDMGEDVKAPAEITEVAQDIVSRIREMRDRIPSSQNDQEVIGRANP